MNNNVEKKYIIGGNKRDIKNKYELVCIHTARRTLATQLYEHGLPFAQIMGSNLSHLNVRFVQDTMGGKFIRK